MKNFIIATVGILIALSIFVIINVSRTPQKPKSPIMEKKVTQKTAPVEAKLKTYSDPSGFTFQYQEGVIVTDKNSPNSPLYSSLEIAEKGKPEKIAIKVEDSDLIAVDDWFKGTNKTSVFGEIKKIKLADLDARQFEANNLKTTIALDQGVLFTLATNAKKDSELSKAYDTVIKTFKFIQPSLAIQNNSSTSSDDSSDVIDEGEEFVE